MTSPFTSGTNPVTIAAAGGIGADGADGATGETGPPGPMPDIGLILPVLSSHPDAPEADHVIFYYLDGDLYVKNEDSVVRQLQYADETGFTTYTTFDPNNKSSVITLSNGDLTADTSSDGNQRSVLCKTFRSTGKLYAEFLANAGTIVGIGRVLPADNSGIGDTAEGYAYHANGGKNHNSSFSGGWGASFTTADVISVLLNANIGEISFWKNGTDQGVAYTGISGNHTLGLTDYASAGDVTVNTGASAFTYTPPTGYTGWVS